MWHTAPAIPMRRCITISRISTTCFSVVWRISVRRSAISWQPGRRGALPAGRGCVERPGLMWSPYHGAPRQAVRTPSGGMHCRRNLHGRRGGCRGGGASLHAAGYAAALREQARPRQLRGVHAVGRCAARQGNRLRHAAAVGQGAPWRQGAPCVCSSLSAGVLYGWRLRKFSVLLRGL